MLLNESQSSSSLSRNSSPNVIVLALANPDTGRPGNGSHPSSPPGVPLLLPTIITIHNSNSDQSNEPLEGEGARTTTAREQLQGWNPGDTLRDEGANDRNISDLITVAARVPSNDGMTTMTRDTAQPGLVARGQPSEPSHGPPIPVPILPSAPLHPVPISRSNATTMGGPSSSADPHTGELEQYVDALLQWNTISAVIQMATALALQQLANFIAGQPGSEDNNIPKRLANTS